MKKTEYLKYQKNNVLICLTVARNITANVSWLGTVADYEKSIFRKENANTKTKININTKIAIVPNCCYKRAKYEIRKF